MTRFNDTTLDAAEKVFGVPLLIVVATVTAAFMAVGLAAITVVDRLLH